MARIFLCHASDDKAHVREVYHRLRAIEGFEPWLDEEDLLPGQVWAREIPRALQTSDFILIFLSRTSVAKRGYVQREMKMALDAWEELPEGTIHTIPVRLDDCNVPEQFRRYHWANLFEPSGFDRIVRAIRTELAKRPVTESTPILEPPLKTSPSEEPATKDTVFETSFGRRKTVDGLSDHDRQRLEDLDELIHNALHDLNEINQKQAYETRTLASRQLDQDALQVRKFYNQYREEYADLFIHTVVQQLHSDQQTVTHTALQEADRDPDDPTFIQLLAEILAALPSVQQQLAAKNTPAAKHVAHVAQVIQAPTANLNQKLKLSIPLIPLFLAYETEFNLNITASLKAAWERLTQRFPPQ